MAILQIEMFSKALMRAVPFTALVPVDNVRYDGDPEREPGKSYKTLYLMHGMYGSHFDWLTISNIRQLSQAFSLVVIMPAAENHFYVDNAATGEAYGRFIGEELVEQTRRMFPLSRKRENTFIAGLSMGGYGAVINGLKYSDTFGYVAGLSSGFILEQIIASDNSSKDFTARRSFYEAIFGDLNKLKGSDKDYCALYQTKKEEGKVLPKFYLACGTEDFLIEPNRAYRDFLREQGADLTYEEGPGGHEAEFWHDYIEHVLSWLPLEDYVDGINRGNVRRENDAT